MLTAVSCPSVPDCPNVEETIDFAAMQRWDGSCALIIASEHDVRCCESRHEARPGSRSSPAKECEGTWYSTCEHAVHYGDSRNRWMPSSSLSLARPRRPYPALDIPS